MGPATSRDELGATVRMTKIAQTGRLPDDQRASSVREFTRARVTAVTSGTGRSPLRPLNLVIGLSGAALFGVLAGVWAGGTPPRNEIEKIAAQRGACLALEMAEAYRYIDAEQKRRTIHALTDGSFPHRNDLPRRYAELQAVCDTLRSGP